MRPSQTIKALPFIVLAFNLIVVVALWWQGPSGILWQSQTPGSRLIATGRLVGLLAELAILTQLVLIGRMPFIERIFGFDRLNRVHRWIGYCFLFFILLHPLFLTWGYSRLGNQPFTTQFLTFLTDFEDVLNALIGLIIIVSVVAISYPYIRNRLRYETWHGLHLLMYVAIGLIFEHQINTADVSRGGSLYYWLTLNFLIFGLLILYRFLRPWYLFQKHRFTVARIQRETDDVWSIYITGHNLEQFHFQAGQYANVMFLARGLWYPHPFSFSQAENGKELRFTMRQIGNFTKMIDQLKLGTRVLLDGPLGVFTAERAKTNKLLLVAGGIGITPLRSIAEAHQDIDRVLLYGNRKTTNVPLLNELKNLNLPIHEFYSEGNTNSGQASRIDAGAIMHLVPDWCERDIYICGPGTMMIDIAHDLKQKGMPKNQIHYENFYH